MICKFVTLSTLFRVPDYSQARRRTAEAFRDERTMSETPSWEMPARALRRQRSDDSEPTRDGKAENALHGIRGGSELLTQPSRTQQRDTGRATAKAPVLPHKLAVEIRHARCVRQTGDGLPFDRNTVLAAFPEERVAKRHNVVRMVLLSGLGVRVPEAHAFEEVKSATIGQLIWAKPVVSTEQNCGRANPLEALDNAAVMAAVFPSAGRIQASERRSRCGRSGPSSGWRALRSRCG
jgi:hypothetical protein